LPLDFDWLFSGVHAVQAGNLDLSYLRRLASDIGVTSKLADILGGKIGPKIT
jgi:hypothetical protein